jgi:predicted nuclease of predicted toxin-antitoxin system
MKILLDECLPRKLKTTLFGFDVQTVPENGWAGKKNGELLRLMADQFDVFVTIDGNLPSQQNLVQLKVALVVLKARDNTFTTLQPLMGQVVAALDELRPGDIRVITQNDEI